MSKLSEWAERMGALTGPALRWCTTDRPAEPERSSLTSGMAGLIQARGEFSRLAVVQRPSGAWCVAVLVDEGYADREVAESVLAMFVDQLDVGLSSRVQSSTLAHMDPQSQGG